MKTLKYLYGCLMMAVCFSFAACSDDDDVDISASDLYGTWTVVTEEYNYKENGKVVESGTDNYEDGEWTITFNEDGTLIISEYGSNDQGTWSLKGNKLSFGYYDVNQTITIIEYNGNRAVVEGRDTYTDEGVKYDDYSKMTLKKIG